MGRVCSSLPLSKPLGHPLAPALALTTSPASPLAQQQLCHEQRLENCLWVRFALSRRPSIVQPPRGIHGLTEGHGPSSPSSLLKPTDGCVGNTTLGQPPGGTLQPTVRPEAPAGSNRTVTQLSTGPAADPGHHTSFSPRCSRLFVLESDLLALRKCH